MIAARKMVEASVVRMLVSLLQMYGTAVRLALTERPICSFGVGVSASRLHNELAFGWRTFRPMDKRCVERKSWRWAN